MKEIIKDLPDQLRRSRDSVSSAGIRAEDSGYGAVYLGGMGGSAIAGDILRDYVRDRMTIPLQVIRGYALPPAPRGKLLFVASSYSGNTEEVLSLLDQAEALGADIYVTTTGGALKERAKAKGYPTLLLPTGYPPRGALGHSFVALLYLLGAFYPGVDLDTELIRTADLLDSLTPSYSSSSSDCPPHSLAKRLVGKIPIIYAPMSLVSVATRWKGQFAENAKVLAFMGILPEMNHNEICGWQNNPDLLKSLHVLLLRDKGEHPRNGLRMEVTRELIEPFAGGISEVNSSGKSLLERIFSLIYFGDFVSFYLSHFLDTDPMVIRKIDALKERLAQSSPE